MLKKGKQLLVNLSPEILNLVLSLGVVNVHAGSIGFTYLVRSVTVMSIISKSFGAVSSTVNVRGRLSMEGGRFKSEKVAKKKIHVLNVPLCCVKSTDLFH